jgi:hypothetical protein
MTIPEVLLGKRLGHHLTGSEDWGVDLAGWLGQRVGECRPGLTPTIRLTSLDCLYNDPSARYRHSLDTHRLGGVTY